MLSRSPLFTLVALSWAATSMAGQLQVLQTDDRITIQRGDTPVLTYHTAVMPSPEGVSPAYRRSGFIHPLHAPNGDIVTSIHAPDHYHHMGLWHAWVKTKWMGRELDFWNVKSGDATVRYVDTLALQPGGESAGFTVRQQQVALAKDEHAETVILEEELQVLVTATDAANIIDYTITQTNVTDAVFELPAYRYGGGIAYRAPLDWGEDEDAYLTSTGLGRDEGHATRGDWVAMHGPTEQGEATVVIMGHPDNHDAPQRMRIWPKGKVFFNYVPAQEHAWQIAPGETISLRYRVVVFPRGVDAAVIEDYWNRYQ